MKQKLISIKLNFIYSILSQLFLYITPLIVAPYITRVLGSSGVGEFSLGNSIIYYFNIIIIFGFTTYGTSSVSKNRFDDNELNKTFWGVIFSRIIFCLICISSYVALIFFGLFNQVISKTILFALLPIMISSTIDCTFFLQGIEKFKIISFMQFLLNLLYVVLLFVLVNSEDDLLIYTLIKSLSSLMINLVLFTASLHYLKIKKPNLTFVKKTIKFSFPFFIPSILMTITPMIDQTMLGYLTSKDEVAYYEQTYKITSLANMLIGAIAPVLLSRLSFLIKNENYAESKIIIENTIEFAYLLIIPVSLGIISISKRFVPGYFGEDFYPAIPTMCVLALSILFSPISSIIINAFFYPMKKERIVTIVLFLSIMINTIFNFIAIKYLGSLGASITTTSLSIIGFIFYVMYSKKFINYFSIFKKIWKKIISGFLMTSVVLIIDYFMIQQINNNIVVLLIEVPLGALVYFISLLAFRDKFFIGQIQKIFKKIRSFFA